MQALFDVVAFWIPWAVGLPIVILVAIDETRELVFCIRYAVYQQRFNLVDGLKFRFRFRVFLHDLRFAFGKRRGLQHVLKRR